MTLSGISDAASLSLGQRESDRLVAVQRNALKQQEAVASLLLEAVQSSVYGNSGDVTTGAGLVGTKLNASA